MKSLTLIALIASIFLFTTCEKAPLSPPVIDPALQPYYDSFMKEANVRNKKIERTEGMKIKFGVEKKYYGVAYIEQRIIVIDSAKWKYLDNVAREFVMFHELGHLLFWRKHEQRTLPNFEYSSMMFTYENNPELMNSFLYAGIRRKYYIDELFNVNTEIPEWAKENFDPFPIQNSTRKLVASQTFDETKSLNNYLETLPNAKYNTSEKGLLNVKLPKGFDFLLDAEKVMEMASIEASKRAEILQSINYEIEVRYRLKSGIFNSIYSPNSFQNQFTFSHNFNLNTYSVLSLFHQHNFGNYNIKPDFNTIRFIRKNGFWTVYRNDKNLFYSDVFTPEQADKMLFFINGREENTEFDLDYFNIYTL